MYWWPSRHNLIETPLNTFIFVAPFSIKGICEECSKDSAIDPVYGCVVMTMRGVGELNWISQCILIIAFSQLVLYNYMGYFIFLSPETQSIVNKKLRSEDSFLVNHWKGKYTKYIKYRKTRKLIFRYNK